MFNCRPQYRMGNMKGFKDDNKMARESCCAKPDLRRCWIPCWPFRGKHCLNCYETTSDMGWLLEWVWRVFVWPFWGGHIEVEVRPGDSVKLG